ncbi:DUF1033 family protein [Streptococcus sp. DD13]|uniref:DUF1033 family protein n=1 Tax=Streptococcus sp. DD13 TaxID=1777881 RepID=UPI00079AE2DA|nr:DUF1033 family protein [Streptococcus sp. DD13]KXT77916.1 DNA binding protein [Streptococcus sp. DD13]
MYQVITMYGDAEPWWFLDGWEEDIVSSVFFEEYDEALRYYQREWVHLAEQFSQRDTRKGTMAAFWDTTDQLWCDECDEYLQQYHSLMLMETKDALPKGLQQKTGKYKVRPCRLKN